MLNGVTAVENSVKAPQKVKNRTIVRSSNLTYGIYPKELKSGFQREISIPMFIVALFPTVMCGNSVNIH